MRVCVYMSVLIQWPNIWAMLLGTSITEYSISERTHTNDIGNASNATAIHASKAQRLAPMLFLFGCVRSIFFFLLHFISVIVCVWERERACLPFIFSILAYQCFEANGLLIRVVLYKWVIKRTKATSLNIFGEKMGKSLWICILCSYKHKLTPPSPVSRSLTHTHTLVNNNFADSHHHREFSFLPSISLIIHNPQSIYPPSHCKYWTHISYLYFGFDFDLFAAWLCISLSLSQCMCI